MNKRNGYERLLFQYEVLRAQFELREYFLEFIVKDMYENIGQVLSLVRMQLSTSFNKEMSVEKIMESRDLIRIAIEDLRDLCRHFYPDIRIFQEIGWIGILNLIIDNLSLEQRLTIETEGDQLQMPLEISLILIKVLVEIVFTIEKNKGRIIRFCIFYHEEGLEIIINYNGESIQWDKIADNQGFKKQSRQSFFYERIYMIDGNLSINALDIDIYNITLQLPIKPLLQ